MPRAVQLPRLLSLLPRDGVGAKVFQSRWAGKDLPVPSASSVDGACYWEITRVRLRYEDGKVKGRSWGRHFHKGKLVTEGADEPVRGGLKYLWQSAVPPSILINPSSSSSSAPPADA
ncbi:hypothetical protein JCM8547_002050 [Rhodosporidiobolus lusitaniae]